MLHDWYRAVRLPMSADEFRRLPRHPAFRYEYGDDSAHLSPRPKTLNALLPLRPQAPPDAAARGLARPHLTWVFVAPLYTGHGIGSALLVHAGNALLSLGFSDLASTFSLGNESSTLWHWRNGFALMPYPASLCLVNN